MKVPSGTDAVDRVTKPYRTPLRLVWLVPAALLQAVDLLLHKQVSDICDALLSRWGLPAYDLIMLVSIPAVTVAVAGLVLRQALWQRVRRSLPAFLVLAILTVAAQRLLLVVNVELIHLPQYALLAACLLAAGMSASTAWLVATAGGVVDEVYQHFVIYAGVPDTYLDFNDMVLNGLGAAWIVLLVSEAEPPRRGRLIAVALVSSALTIAVWLDPPVLRPFLTTGRTDRQYRVLSAPEALIVLFAVWSIIRHTAGALSRQARTRSVPVTPASGGTLA